MIQADFRSDTFTKPTPEMLAAMFHAEVGDDVFGEDPTVNALQAKGAAIFGMESGLFCPSGTMCNQIAIRCHTQPQDEVICDKTSHVYLYEGGGMAYNSFVSARLVDGDRGRIHAADILACINPDNIHYTPSRLVVLENTSNKGGGSYYSLPQIIEISEACRAQGLALHVDGARIFNALIETGENPLDYGKYVDSISFCLSKGLGAPIGSLLIGKKGFIRKALRVRKVLGGGMRQAGYLAAAGIYALDHHIERLKIDHDRARAIGEVLRQKSWISQVLPVDTNIVIATHDPRWKSTESFLKTLDGLGVKAIAFGTNQVRFVTHLDIDENQMHHTLDVLANM